MEDNHNHQSAAINFTHLDEEHIAEMLEKAKGPLKWHKRCGAIHHSRENCNLVEVERVAKSGKEVTRFTRAELV